MTGAATGRSSFHIQHSTFCIPFHHSSFLILTPVVEQRAVPIESGHQPQTSQGAPMSSAIVDRRIHVAPADVHNVLSRHMLADGYEIVMDLKKSRGSWVFDARRGRPVLDFFTNFA